MASGVQLDIDGVLAVSWRPLPGAAETLGWLTGQALPFRLVTNTSSRTRRQLAQLLSDAGVTVDPTDTLTAVSRAARYLDEHYHGVGCLVVNDGPLDEDPEGVEFVDADRAGVVLLGGAGPSLGYRQLDTVFKLAGRSTSSRKHLEAYGMPRRPHAGRLVQPLAGPLLASGGNRGRGIDSLPSMRTTTSETDS